MVLASAFALGLSVKTRWSERSGLEAAPRPVADRGEPLAAERHTIELFRAASPSVVFITTIERVRSAFNLRPLDVPSGSGSGFVWDEHGNIVTNFHVIRRANRAQVTLADQSTWEAKLVGVAPDKDLAVLRIEAPRDVLEPIPIGRSSSLLVGQSVYAIGNPFGLDHTLTTGVISALGREIESLADRRPIRDVVQTDAAINPGNSGGPLLDSRGRLIGVNTQIYSPSGASAGIGFAIPVDTVNWVVPDLIEYGEIRRPMLGVSLFGDDVLRRSRVEGALINDVTPGSGAERAGLQPTRRTRRGWELGDIVVAVDGQPVTSGNDLILLLEKYEAGDRVTVTVLRDGRRRDVEVELGSGR